MSLTIKEIETLQELIDKYNKELGECAFNRYDVARLTYFNDVPFQDVTTNEKISLWHIAESTWRNYASQGEGECAKLEGFAMVCPAYRKIKEIETIIKEEEAKRWRELAKNQEITAFTILKESYDGNFVPQEKNAKHYAYLLAMYEEIRPNVLVFRCLKVGETQDVQKRIARIKLEQENNNYDIPFIPRPITYFECKDKTQGWLFEAAMRQALHSLGGYNIGKSKDYVFGVPYVDSVVDTIKKAIDQVKNI